MTNGEYLLHSSQSMINKMLCELSELKLCKACSAKPMLREWNGLFYVECQCQSHTPVYSKQDSAIAAWNRKMV